MFQFCHHIEFRTEFSSSDFSGKCCVEQSWASPHHKIIILTDFESRTIYKNSHNVLSFPDYKSVYKETRKMYFRVHDRVDNQRLKSSNAQTRSIQQMDFY